jgi:hypothetical protein
MAFLTARIFWPKFTVCICGLLTILEGAGGFIICAAFSTIRRPTGVSKNSVTFVIVAALPQHFLYFRPEPQGHREFRGVFA